MRHLLAAGALLAAFAFSSAAATTPAFPFTYYIHDTTSVNADTPLPSIYQFAATPVGSNSNIVLKAVNTSPTTAFLASAFVSTSASSVVHNSNFTITGLALQQIIPAGGSIIFTINFSPTASGTISGFLQTSYQVQQTGCNFTSTDVTTQCPSGLNVSATLNGTATQPQLVLSYKDSSGTVNVMQPGASAPLNFGSISTSASTTITFTLSNQSTVDIAVPAITIPAPTIYSSNPFSLNISQIPVTLTAQTSANFTVTFAPGQTGLATVNLLVGSNTYPIEGEGIIVADIDALSISYVDSTGVRSLPQAASPIPFGQLVAGGGSSQVLTFTIANPSTSFNAVTVPSITVTGTGFQLNPTITGATAFPDSLAPGGSIVFKVSFTAGSAGSYSGVLSIGPRVFSLAGIGINSPLPSFSVVVAPSPLTSQQQATVSVQFASPSALTLSGNIAMSFTPSVTGVTDDQAIKFVDTNSRSLTLSVAASGQTATYNGESAIPFQSGTTAGTITFTVAFLNTPVYTQSFTIPPAIPQITSATAVRSNPNLVITLVGYDNTYSAGQMNFTFYDTSGNLISPVSLNATSNFQSLFFNNNKGGGAFSLIATFPVTGDVTKVGSVAVTLSNSVGQATQTLKFQ